MPAAYRPNHLPRKAQKGTYHGKQPRWSSHYTLFKEYFYFTTTSNLMSCTLSNVMILSVGVLPTR